jgi:hypothetical protein
MGGNHFFSPPACGRGWRSFSTIGAVLNGLPSPASSRKREGRK